MAYEKLLNEIYAALSLEYVWPEYRPAFRKSESPDWVNPAMELGLEVSQALMPEDGQTESFIEQYLGKPREEIPLAALERYRDRLHFYNGRFWAILPGENEKYTDFEKAAFRFEKKLEKLNTNYRKMKYNGLYLFVHPAGEQGPDMAGLFQWMKNRQSREKVRFDWVFLLCRNRLTVLDFQKDRMEAYRISARGESFLTDEAERIREEGIWKDGVPFQD